MEVSAVYRGEFPDADRVGFGETNLAPTTSFGVPERVATALLSLGLVLVVLAALPFKTFELERYFVPKELVLHIVALLVAALLLLRTRRITFDAADALLAVFLVWSAASALLATNYWLAQRALGVSVSGAIVFWAARRLGAAGLYRPILLAAAVATVCAAAMAVAQAYGVDTEYFSLNRVPGGTFGNRNFVAHFCVIGLPALVYCTVTSRRPIVVVLGSLGTGVVAAALVLSRSRAAWLAVAASLVILIVPLIASRRYWRGHHIGRRLARLALAGGVAGGLAIFVPNTLNWRSNSPYLDSARGLVDYSSGSGRGRVAQYRNSLRLVTSHPVLGVGPGNWPVRYVQFARANDPSLADDGMTANPWPSSDWVAFLTERGVIAVLLLLGVFASLFTKACRRWSELPDSDAVLAKLALIGTITATLVVSAFDAVLLLAAPAFLAWCIMGAASGIGRRGRAVMFSGRTWATVCVLTIFIVGASLVRSVTQTVAIATVGSGATRAEWTDAAAWDPGSYRINVRVAELYVAQGRCAQSRVYARRALELFPYSAAPKRLLQRCG